MLMRWSNDRLKATLHQVETPPTLQKQTEEETKGGAKCHGASEPSPVMIPERFSIAFFCNANKDVELECLETCCGPDEPVKYPPINAHKYLTQRLVDTIKTN
jgi:isopenicillin N synthase-like dioxygenase